MEHWIATCNKNINLSSIAEHCNLYYNSHTLSKDKPLLNLKIIDRDNSYTERKIKEKQSGLINQNLFLIKILA